MTSVHDHGGFGPYTVLDLHERAEDGKGFELEDGWLIELSPSIQHNWVAENLADILKAEARSTRAPVKVCYGGEWEMSVPAGIRKPDILIAPRGLLVQAAQTGSPKIIPGRDVLLAVEVVAKGSASERTDRVRKVGEYAALGVPQYWIVDFDPSPRVTVMVLESASAHAYRLERSADAGELLKVEISTGDGGMFTAEFDPAHLVDFEDQ